MAPWLYRVVRNESLQAARAAARRRRREEGASAPEAWFARAMSEKRVLHGYGRPQHGHDERIAVVLRSLASAGMQAGEQLKRAFWLHRVIEGEKGVEMNISAVWAALAIDFGITLREYEQFMLLMFAPGYAAVYADQRKRPCLSFLHGHQTRASAPARP